MYGGSALHWGLETEWGRLFDTWASFGQEHGQAQGQPGPHLMAALLGCDRVVACANVMEPMADRRRADSTDVEDTQDPASCSIAKM